jgi:hypothetical protein
MKYQKTNFYPRIGVAYQLTADGKTALRAGYGDYGSTVYPSAFQKERSAVVTAASPYLNATAATVA